MADVSIYEQKLQLKRKTGIPRLLEIAGTKSILLIFASLLAVVAVLAQITPFLTVFLLVQELIGNIGNLKAIDQSYVWSLAWFTLGGVAVSGIMLYAGGMLSHIAAFNILYEIRVALAGKLARLPMGFFTRNASGRVKKVLSEDVERIELFVAHHILDILQAAVLPVVSITALFVLDWRLGLGAVIPVPLALLAQYSMMNESGLALYKQWQEKLSSMNGTIVEYVRGMPVVKVFNQTVGAFKRFAADVYAYRDLTLHWIKVSSTPFGGFITLLSSSALFITPIAIFLIRAVPEDGYASLITTVFLFLFISMGIAVPMYKLMTLVPLLIQVSTGLASIDDILDEKEIADTQSKQSLQDAEIKFKDVVFAYEQKPVLNGVSFTVHPGTVTALVGPSGGGKTTIANLIGRFWDVKTGSVTIGGMDIRDMAIEQLNETVSTVFQDVFLFFDTIEENIRMGNAEASFADVQAAAKAAQIHEFIESLPDGYQTLIGEGGTYLSGGEQQRVSIARAILKDAPVVVLDEATAYADPENEARIQAALAEVLRNKTVVIIAHRLYTITDVDQILVINNGRIEESGTHGELLAESGLYKRMWDVHAAARNWNIDTEEKK
ncbi:ABC transporter ATP-binding protein [Salinispira pacifica]|uniref:ABC transporter ATP-binding protein n=1 Tax=Salinispira pacifica TaxID=1307761 RepID=V5WFV8_9SPIO|nr:ABC transporter ATP-binding protein [Salinispira pacifica]AHC14031.1 ABC transporter ATP-binding protein [Salinispira pacifica]